ncbi:hypothetical protein PSACC_02252 [Paramicrosporidium saccamoebae]|uniref:U3 small nucleolar RNA-associated protein 14 n=1 Tax=Paramicrosporidium saccamoebae TaxID=1246581 RepID=A0A2H9TJL9_9FUNG|nr:hypothetical protein PSACC_02252 [Paramicrosporidium saccamoebae]
MGKKDSGIDKDLLSFVTGLDADASADRRNLNKSTALAEHAQEGEQVSIAELTAVLDDETGFADLKKRIGDIVEAENAVGKRGVANVEIVAAPLASHEQKRLERKAAYELSSKEVNKWIPVIRANRNAKVLSFPAKQPRPTPSTGDILATAFEPKTDLEKTMNEMLKKSGMDTEEGITTAEQLEMSKLTPEEVERRYQELAKRRALLFFNEQKNKRQSKIKSKTFRKVVKREKERRMVKDVDASGERLTEEEIREERMKAELGRIKERMTLKTRKATKWAHDLMQKRRLESGSREEVMQQVRDKDRLRQEIFGKASQYAEEFSGSELDSDNAEGDHFHDEEDSSDEEGTTEDFKSLSKSKKKRHCEDDYVETSEESGIDSFSGHEMSGEMDEIFEDKPEAAAPIGRRVFAPTNPINKEIESLPNVSTKKSKNPETVSSIFGDDEVILPVADKAKPKSSSGRTRRLKGKMQIPNLFAPEDEQSITLDEKTKGQLEVIKQAFDGDNVFAEFQQRKQEEIDEDKPKDVDLTLPGWGTWGGLDIEAPKGKIILKAQEGLDPRKRKDANLSHVIIHEKRSKKMAKLMIDRPPFPFKSHEEYERSLQKPVGKEWNCATNFTKNIQSRVRVKVGSIIDPIKFVKKDYSK